MERAFASQTQNFPRLHVSGFFLGTQDSSGNIGNRTCVVKARKIYVLRESGNEVPVLKTVYMVIVIMIMNVMMMMMIIIIIIIIIVIILKIFIQEVAITHGWFTDETCL